jgi:hypothetical protein
MNPERRELSADRVSRLTMDPGPWMSCDSCFHLVDQYVEMALSGGDGMPGMRAHLAGCPACSEEATSLLLLAAAERRLDPGPALRRMTGG